ncbi:MAG TPA: carbohydrate ABC transporter permease [Trebonia sp.]|jgi:raffinose/stachyose/melibiose transport system permease protein|nr:carbohydrate ABC transporter permease [Trebonia sp.]
MTTTNPGASRPGSDLLWPVETATPARRRSPRRSPVAALAATPRRGLVGVLIALVLVVEIYPLFWLLTSSFKSEDDFETQPLWTMPQHFDWHNYVSAWQTAALGQTALNSLIVTIVSMAVILIVGSAAAFALEVMIWRGRRSVLLFVIGGLMVPTQLILLPLYTIYYHAGITNSLFPLIITYVGQGLPLTVFLMATYFRSVPLELFEASALDGAGIFRCFFSVGLPLVRNGIYTMAMLLFFSIWNDLLVALTFNTQPSLATVQVGLLNFDGQYGQVSYGPLLAAICIIIFAMLIVYALVNQRVMKGLTAGSIKG